MSHDRAAARFLASGVRSVERGTISMDRDADGNDVPSDLELCRMAVPRRVYSVFHMGTVAERWSAKMGRSQSPLLANLAPHRLASRRGARRERRDGQAWPGVDAEFAPQCGLLCTC